MSAVIIPFRSRGDVEHHAQLATEVRPPVLMSRSMREGRLWSCKFLGTREALIAWDVARENEFPTGRKRKAFNGFCRPTVTKECGFFDSYYAQYIFHGTPAPECIAAAESLIKTILRHSNDFELETQRCMTGLSDLRDQLFVRHMFDYDHAHLCAFDELVDGLQTVIAATLRHNSKSP